MNDDEHDNKFQLDEASQKQLADIIQRWREQKVAPAPDPKPKTLSEVHGEILAEGQNLSEAGAYTFEKANPAKLGLLMPSNSPGEPQRWHFQNWAKVYRPDAAVNYPPHLYDQHVAVPTPNPPAPFEQPAIATSPALTTDSASPVAFDPTMAGEAQREPSPPNAFQDVQRERPPSDVILAVQRPSLDHATAVQDITREQGTGADIDAEKRQSRSADAQEYQAKAAGEKKERDKQIELAQAQAKAQAQAQNRD